MTATSIAPRASVTASGPDLLRRVDDLHRRARRFAAQRPVLDLGIPNPRVVRDPRGHEVLRRVAATIEPARLQYTPLGGGTVARRRIAAGVTERAGSAVHWSDVVLTPGATSALCAAFETLFRPGDEVLVPTPCWMDYPAYLQRHGVRPRLVPTGPDKTVSLAGLVESASERTAGIILTQPGCPTGVALTEHVLDGVAEVVEAIARRHGRRVTVVADEAHRDQAWGSGPLPSPLAHVDDSVSVYSFGKAWGLQGQRTGYVVVNPRHRDRDGLRTRLVDAVRDSGACAPTALMQDVVAELSGLTPDTTSLAHDQHRLRAQLTSLGRAPVPATATSFVYLRAPEAMDDWTAVEALAHHGVLALPSSLFHEPGHVRFSLNEPPALLDLLPERLDAAWPDDAHHDPDDAHPTTQEVE